MDAWLDEDQEVEIDPVTDTHSHGNPLVDWLMRDAWEASSISELPERVSTPISAASSSAPVGAAVAVPRTPPAAATCPAPLRNERRLIDGFDPWGGSLSRIADRFSPDRRGNES